MGNETLIGKYKIPWETTIPYRIFETSPGLFSPMGNIQNPIGNNHFLLNWENLISHKHLNFLTLLWEFQYSMVLCTVYLLILMHLNSRNK